MPRRPKRIVVADVIVRAIRGPKPDDRDRFYWQAQRSVDGVRQTVWSGWATRAEATRIVIDLVALSASRPQLVPLGEDPLSATQLATVTDLLETWVGSRLSRFEAGDLTIYGYQNSKTDAGHIKDHIGDTAIARLRKADIEGLRNARLREGAASSTVHRELKALRSAWKWARGDGYVPDRDLPKVPIKVTPVREKYNPTPDEVWRVVDHMEGWAKFVGGMQAATGARVGEIAQLTWTDIHFGSGHLKLRGKKGPRLFPITDKVREVLSWGDPDAVHPHGTTENMVRGHLSSRELLEACEAAGVRRFTSHGFRRAAVDRLQRGGVDIKTAADLLGHSPTTMLEYYREVSTEDLQSAAAVLGDVKQPCQQPPELGHEAPAQDPREEPPQAARKRRRVTDRGYSAKSADRRSGKSEGPRTLRASEGLRFGTPKGTIF